MIRRAVVAACVMAVVLSPAASAQGLAEALSQITFAEVSFHVGQNEVAVRADGFRLQGQAASEFRRCIDGQQCPIEEFNQFPHGDRDGTVSQDEVDIVVDLVLNLWNAVPEIRAVSDVLKATVTVDGRAAQAIRFDEFLLQGATGPVGSRETIEMAFRLTAEYRTTEDADRHTITVERAESEITFTQRIVVQAASGWKIDEDSIQPPGMAARFSDGRFEGSQNDFEGAEPLTFDISKKGSNWLAWTLGTLAVLALAGIVVFFVWRARKP